MSLWMRLLYAVAGFLDAAIALAVVVAAMAAHAVV
jgi:hypothetical protein